MLAALRFAAPALPRCWAGREHGRWLIAPSDSSHRVERRYLDGSLVLATTFETSAGAVELIDFFRPRRGPLYLVRLVRGLRGRVAMGVEFICVVSITARWSPGSSRCQRAAFRRWPDLSRWCCGHRCRSFREDHNDHRRVRDQRRANDPVRADLRPVQSAATAAGQCRTGPAQFARLLATVVRPMRPGGTVDRPVQALPDRTEGPRPMRRPAASLPRRRPPCPSRSAAPATGIIGIAGCVTLPSLSWRC